MDGGGLFSSTDGAKETISETKNLSTYFFFLENYRARKEFHKTRIMSQLRKDFFTRKDAELIGVFPANLDCD